MFRESYVTSNAWKDTKTRDNQWVAPMHGEQEWEAHQVASSGLKRQSPHICHNVPTKVAVEIVCLDPNRSTMAQSVASQHSQSQ
jgi:hypothetical protein